MSKSTFHRWARQLRDGIPDSLNEEQADREKAESTAAQLLRPLYELQRQLALQSAVMWTDDTPITVLAVDEHVCHQGRFWAYIGDSAHPYSVYEFTMSLGRDGP